VQSGSPPPPPPGCAPELNHSSVILQYCFNSHGSVLTDTSIFVFSERCAAGNRTEAGRKHSYATRTHSCVFWKLTKYVNLLTVHENNGAHYYHLIWECRRTTETSGTQGKSSPKHETRPNLAQYYHLMGMQTNYRDIWHTRQKLAQARNKTKPGPLSI
jgi:hypothetical protein